MSDRWVTVLAAVLGLLGGMAGAAVGGFVAPWPASPMTSVDLAGVFDVGEQRLDSLFASAIEPRPVL